MVKLVVTIASQKDLSDEAFARRHRFPEVLEKRSKRRERERLVHERFKLKTTLDRLRASDNLPSLLPPSTLPATATHHEKVRETERLRVTMLAEAEETLKRYDELLEPRGVTATEKSRRRPPTQRDAPPAVQAPSKAKGKAATESFTITFKRDTQGQLGATSRSRSSSVPPERTKRARATSVQLLSDSDISDAEERPAKRKRRAIVDTFFESDALRQTIFPASGARRRQSGRIQWAFGVKTPDALLHSGEDFDYLVNPLLSEMGREPHPLEPVA
jgi:hypothetical protein